MDYRKYLQKHPPRYRAYCWFCEAEIMVDDDGWATCGCGMSQIVPPEKMIPLDEGEVGDDE